MACGGAMRGRWSDRHGRDRDEGPFRSVIRHRYCARLACAGVRGPRQVIGSGNTRWKSGRDTRKGRAWRPFLCGFGSRLPIRSVSQAARLRRRSADNPPRPPRPPRSSSALAGSGMGVTTCLNALLVEASVTLVKASSSPKNVTTALKLRLPLAVLGPPSTIPN